MGPRNSFVNLCPSSNKYVLNVQLHSKSGCILFYGDFYVILSKHTQLSFASWCMLHIHHSATLRWRICCIYIRLDGIYLIIPLLAVMTLLSDQSGRGCNLLYECSSMWLTLLINEALNENNGRSSNNNWW